MPALRNEPTSSVPPDTVTEVLSYLDDITFILPPSLVDEGFVAVEVASCGLLVNRDKSMVRGEFGGERILAQVVVVI